MVFNSFWFCLILSVPWKLKNTVFVIPIIPQTLNISDQRTTSEESPQPQSGYNKKACQILFKKRSHKGNVYSHRFWDIGVRR